MATQTTLMRSRNQQRQIQPSGEIGEAIERARRWEGNMGRLVDLSYGRCDGFTVVWFTLNRTCHRYVTSSNDVVASSSPLGRQHGMWGLNKPRFWVFNAKQRRKVEIVVTEKNTERNGRQNFTYTMLCDRLSGVSTIPYTACVIPKRTW